VGGHGRAHTDMERERNVDCFIHSGEGREGMRGEGMGRDSSTFTAALPIRSSIAQCL